MKVINLFAGPGAGKSTLSARLFYELKIRSQSVELVTEYAKDLIWEKHEDLMSDQLLVTATQNRRLSRLTGHAIDYVVTDAPLLLGYQYVTPSYLSGMYTAMLFELWNRYENVNFVLTRTKPYDPVGRQQTEDQAIQIDQNIVTFLDGWSVPYVTVDNDDSVCEKIMQELGF